MRRIRARHAIATLAMFLSVIIGVPDATAQAPSPGPSAVLIIDPERLFEETEFGQGVIAESEARAEALQAENRRIEAELTEEERELTAVRPTLSVDEFRSLADAFDEKVDRIRREQDAKAREVQDVRDGGQQEFFNRIGAVLLSLVRQRNAAILLDRRTVFLSAEAVDITDDAIARIDAELGSGEVDGGGEPK